MDININRRRNLERIYSFDTISGMKRTKTVSNRGRQLQQHPRCKFRLRKRKMLREQLNGHVMSVNESLDSLEEDDNKFEEHRNKINWLD